MVLCRVAGLFPGDPCPAGLSAVPPLGGSPLGGPPLGGGPLGGPPLAGPLGGPPLGALVAVLSSWRWSSWRPTPWWRSSSGPYRVAVLGGPTLVLLLFRVVAVLALVVSGAISSVDVWLVKRVSKTVLV